MMQYEKYLKKLFAVAGKTVFSNKWKNALMLKSTAAIVGKTVFCYFATFWSNI